MLPNRSLLVVLGICAGFTAIILLLMRPTGDGLDRFPHTFLDQAGYDPAAVTVVIGPLSFPPAIPEGLQPAWACDDRAFADDQGRPWLFPMPMSNGNAEPLPPVHPVLKRRPALATCHLYQTSEGAAQLAAFRTKVIK